MARSPPEEVLDDVSSYERRIRVLKELSEDEGGPFSPVSEAAFRGFLAENPSVRRGRLFLMDNGNLRAVWRDGDDAHIGLQFLDERTVQYVIFSRREASAPVSRVYGRDTPAGVRRLVDAHGLSRVLLHDRRRSPGR